MYKWKAKEIEKTCHSLQEKNAQHDRNRMQNTMNLWIENSVTMTYVVTCDVGWV